MKILIDADPIVYRSGFAAEDTGWHVIGELSGSGMVEGRFTGDDAKERAAKFASTLDVVEHFKRYAIPEPLSHALHLVNQEIEGIISAVQNSHFANDRTVDIAVYITGKDNYRVEIAKQRVYKGNRDPEHKPYWYNQIREHLQSSWDALKVDGREADDEVSIKARELPIGSYVVATIDKDLDQIVGKHYDYRQKVFYDVDEDTARRAFWRQTLSGDATDNVPGAYRIGDAKADRFVTDSWALTDDSMWYGVVRMYEATARQPDTPYTVKEAEEVALETARLVYLQQRPNELWTPPGVGDTWNKRKLVPMGTIRGNLDD